MNWEKYYELYPVNQEMIWLNNCGTTPTGKPILDSVKNFLDGYSKKGIMTEVEKYLPLKKYISETIANLIGASPDEIGIIHNTSEGMNFISNEFCFEKGDEILLLENEYPSNVYPFQHWEQKGIHLKFIPLADSEEKFFHNLVTSVSKKTKLISISLVHWCTGLPFPIQKIGDYCKSQNIELIIDGAQGVGLVPVDVKKMNIASMSFPAWKWLLGPLGLGIIYNKKENLEKRIPIFKGQNSVINADEYLPYKSEWKKGADRYEFSTSSMPDWVYFQASLKMLSEIGFENVQNRIYELVDYFGEILKQNEFEISKDKFESKTGILSIYKEGIDLAKTVQTLKENQVVCALRLGRIRFAPHIYNSKEQFHKVLEILNFTKN
jgi:cysteine desulfurase / selenocysteine lyase